MKTNCKTPIAPSGTPRPLRTLIVDDSSLLRTCLLEAFDTEALIQVVDTAVNGSEAIEKAEALAPDLVLMDLHMPVMDGLQATQLLRRRLPNTRVIIMTMGETVEAKTAARRHGAHGFVDKTRMVRTLMAEIQRVCL